MKKSLHYEAGKTAFFNGLNPQDVSKFHPEDSIGEKEWLRGMTNARRTNDILGDPVMLDDQFNCASATFVNHIGFILHRHNEKDFIISIADFQKMKKMEAGEL